MTAGDWVAVYSAPNLAVAEMLREFLEQAGFVVMLRSPGLSAYIAVDTVELLVPPEQETEAREAVAAFLDGAPGESPKEDDGADGAP